MKRNTIFGAAALLVAGAAIGAGSVVSSNAMADDGGTAPTDALTMISLSSDGGEAVQCTYTGADIAGMIPDMSTAVPTDATKVEGNLVIGSGEITPIDGSLPVLELPTGLVPVEGQVVSGVVSVSGGPGGVVVNGTPGETREGTAEECAAMREQALTDVASIEVTGAGVVTGTNGVTISGGAVVAAEPAKP